MRLRRRMQVLLAAFLVVVVLALGVDVVALQVRARRSDRLIERLAPSRVQLQDLLTSLLDQETGERGYLLTGNPTFLAPYTSGRARSTADLARLQAMVAGDDDLTAGVQRVRSRTQAWQQLGADFEIAAKRDGRDQVVASLVSTGTSKDLFDAVRTEVSDLDHALALRVASLRENVKSLDR